MRDRHTITELIEKDTPFFDLVDDIGGVDRIGDGDELELIDESVALAPILSNEFVTHVDRPPARPATSAIPTSQPMSQPRPNLGWGSGTDGWPRYNSRLVRLFACDPADFIAGVAGRDWVELSLSPEPRLAKAKHPSMQGWPQLIGGTLQMPYRSRALEVELQVQPFHDRYARVDIVLLSRRRWPRRYFDVASICLTRMQQLEERPT